VKCGTEACQQLQQALS